MNDGRGSWHLVTAILRELFNSCDAAAAGTRWASFACRMAQGTMLRFTNLHLRPTSQIHEFMKTLKEIVELQMELRGECRHLVVGDFNVKLGQDDVADLRSAMFPEAPRTQRLHTASDRRGLALRGWLFTLGMQWVGAEHLGQAERVGPRVPDGPVGPLLHNRVRCHVLRAKSLATTAGTHRGGRAPSQGERPQSR